MEPLNPYQSPELPADESETPAPVLRPQRRSNRFADAFVAGTWLFCRNWVRVTIIVLIVWIPIELFVSYQELFVFGPDDIGRYLRLQRMMEGLFGVIGVGAIVAVGATYWKTGRAPGFGEAFSASFSQWGRFIFGGFLGSILMFLGFLLLILPGLYVAACLGYLYPLYVLERPGIVEGIKRALALGQRHFWFSVALMITTTLIELIAGMGAGVAIVGIGFFEPPDNVFWVINALISLPATLVAAWMWLIITAALLRMQEEEQEAKVCDAAAAVAQ